MLRPERARHPDTPQVCAQDGGSAKSENGHSEKNLLFKPAVIRRVFRQPRIWRALLARTVRGFGPFYGGRLRAWDRAFHPQITQMTQMRFRVCPDKTSALFAAASAQFGTPISRARTNGSFPRRASSAIPSRRPRANVVESDFLVSSAQARQPFTWTSIALHPISARE